MADTGNWANLTLNQEISATTISVGRRHFTPATNTTGSPHAPIGLKVGNETLFSGPYTFAIHAINSSAIAAITANGNTCIPFVNSGTPLGELEIAAAAQLVGPHRNLENWGSARVMGACRNSPIRD